MYHVADNGLRGYCSARHRMRFDARNEISLFINALDDVAGTICQTLSNGVPAAGALQVLGFDVPPVPRRAP